MIEKNRITIRRFKPQDRDIIRKLCADTAFMGEPVEKFLKNRELFADLATVYYTDYEPNAIFLAERDSNPVGYIMGALNENDYKAKEYSKIIKPSLKKSWLSLAIAPYSIRLALHMAKSFLKGEFQRPDFSLDYPAHLHINIAEGFRGCGIGSLLMEQFLNYVIEYKVRGVRLATISPKANRFFQKCGFGILYRRRITYFDYLSSDQIYLSIYGKMLE